MSGPRAQATNRPEITLDTAAPGKDASGAIFQRVDDETIDLAQPRFQRIKQLVQSTFGFNVKKFQAGAIADILEACRDVFIIAGMGSGKSIIFQMLPILLKDKIILVVCPTLSLMSDQVWFVNAIY